MNNGFDGMVLTKESIEYDVWCWYYNIETEIENW